jgi:hypothetical protein
MMTEPVEAFLLLDTCSVRGASSKQRVCLLYQVMIAGV